MSSERVIKALVGLGLTRPDAEVYVYLAKKGPQKAVDLAGALEINKQRIYTYLRHLTTKGLVTKNRTMCSALPFEDALDLLIKKVKEQTKAIQESKKELLAMWETKE